MATEELIAGEVIAFGTRFVRVSGMPDGTVCRDYRKRVAVRNFATNRLSYIPEWRLLKAKQQERAMKTKPVVTIERHWDGNVGLREAANGRVYISRGRWQWVVMVDGEADRAFDLRREARAYAEGK